MLIWGNFRYMFGHAVFYVSAVNMGLMAPTAYNTTIRDWSLEYLNYNMPFWVFMLALVSIILFGMLFEYIVSVPAIIAVSNEQMYRHDSPIESDFQEVKAKQVIDEKLLRIVIDHLGIKYDYAKLKAEAEEEVKRRKI
jgi:hypothetical protein